MGTPEIRTQFEPDELQVGYPESLHWGACSAKLLELRRCTVVSLTSYFRLAGHHNSRTGLSKCGQPLPDAITVLGRNRIVARRAGLLGTT